MKFCIHICLWIFQGTVEIADQTEGLEWLASNTDFIDTSRIAVHGWSYGGYLALMGITQRPDVFKVKNVFPPLNYFSFSLYYCIV